MDFYTELKLKNNIHTVASILGYNGKKTGNCYQGNCPRHGSKNGKCLVLWSGGFQGFKCYHCGVTGDVIKLVEILKRIDHKQAVKFLADRVGMPLWGSKELTPEEVAQKEADANERLLVEDMLTEAAEWYHGKLKDFSDIKDHLTNHYGFSQEIIERLRIGFAPPGTSHPSITSDLANHLNNFPEFKGTLVLSGLFNFKHPSGPLWDYFQGRIIFPYWKGGKVVYMAGRATPHTPVYQGEEPAKYTKLRTHKSDDEKRKHISQFIQNDSFMGEDEIRGEKEIIITEGAPDWTSAIDKGFAAVSPVTTNFREQDMEKLAHLTAGAESIYIINDNETNQAGLKGALNTGKFLTKAKRNVFIVEPPRPAGVDKIDLNEYFLNNTAEDLRKLMYASKSLFEILIDGLPGDFIKAQPAIKEDIAPILIELDQGKYEHYLGIIRKKTKTNQKALEAEMGAARKAKREALANKEEMKVDPEVEKGAQLIAMDPLLFKKRINAVNQLGVVGERGTISMYFCALDSRLLPFSSTNSNALAVKNAGHFGSGKSFSLMSCIEIYPQSCYHLITNGSGKSIYYLKEGLKHKALVVTEAFQFQKNNAADSELVYSIRALLSEGNVTYLSFGKDKDGNLTTFERKLEGPTSFITTTIMESLEPQMDDRLFTVHPDESVDQTKRIIMMNMARKAGKFQGLDQKTIDSWKKFHESLKPVDVLIPYAEDIGRFITKDGNPPLATRRASNRVMTVIQSIACAYQHQRKRDGQGRVIAEMGDYWMALQIVQEAFRENMGAQDKKTERYLAAIKEKERITTGNLAKMFGVSGSAISDWSGKRIRDGMIEWVDESWYCFADDKALKTAKRKGVAYLKISETYQNETVKGLPTPFDLTGDPRWKEGGDLLKLYDLELGKQTGVCFEPDGVYGCLPVFTPTLNTVKEDEVVKIIENSASESEGVKVFTLPEGEENIFEKAQEGPGNGQGNIDPKVEPGNGHGNGEAATALDEKTEALAEEFAPFMNPKTTRTPHLCRKGCKHYDSVGDQESAEFKEFCWMKNDSRIERDVVCKRFESKYPNLPEDILTFS